MNLTRADLPAAGQEVPLDEVLRLCELAGLNELAHIIRNDPPPRPFVSDGCSVWPDTWLDGTDLYPGCFFHDVWYWSGRSGEHFRRLSADAWLMIWVAGKSSVRLGEKMFTGVRTGGAEWLQTRWRWGYGR